MSASLNNPSGASTAEGADATADNHDPLHWPARMWIALLIFSGVILLDGLDISMIAVAIPEIQQAFGIGAATAQWLVSAYIRRRRRHGKRHADDQRRRRHTDRFEQRHGQARR